MLPWLLTFALIRSASGYDWDLYEGVMTNVSEQTLRCYYDQGGAIRSVEVEPGQICHGDAIGTKELGVFKIPNRTYWNCWLDQHRAIQCKPQDPRSALILLAAVLRHGPGSYRGLTWSEFMEAMQGHRHTVHCL